MAIIYGVIGLWIFVTLYRIFHKTTPREREMEDRAWEAYDEQVTQWAVLQTLEEDDK